MFQAPVRRSLVMTKPRSSDTSLLVSPVLGQRGPRPVSTRATAERLAVLGRRTPCSFCVAEAQRSKLDALRGAPELPGMASFVGEVGQGSIIVTCTEAAPHGGKLRPTPPPRITAEPNPSEGPGRGDHATPISRLGSTRVDRQNDTAVAGNALAVPPGWCSRFGEAAPAGDHLTT